MGRVVRVLKLFLTFSYPPPIYDFQLHAKEADLSLSSIRRAQERLNIKPFRPYGEKVWFWALPKIHRLDEPTHF